MNLITEITLIDGRRGETQELAPNFKSP